MKIRRSHIVAFIVVVAVIAGAVAANVMARNDAANQKVPGKGGRGGNTRISVKTMTLENTTLHGYISTNGEVESQNSVSVFPDAAGKVMEMSVSLGSKVKKGQVLGYIDPNSPGSYYKRSPIYAPISGSVISIPLKNGTTVSTNSAVCTIGDISNLQVAANVPERYVSALKTDLKADISLEAYPEAKFRATVKRVSPVVDSASRTKQIVLTFDEKDERINAGMFAKVILFTEDYEGNVAMPTDSIVQNGEKYYIYIVGNNSTVSKREVELGKSVDGMTQILSGAKEGEIAVIQGQTSLGDGSRVLIIEGDSPKGKQSEEKQGRAKSNREKSSDDIQAEEKPGREKSSKDKQSEEKQGRAKSNKEKQAEENKSEEKQSKTKTGRERTIRTTSARTANQQKKAEQEKAEKEQNEQKSEKEQKSTSRTSRRTSQKGGNQ